MHEARPGRFAAKERERGGRSTTNPCTPHPQASCTAGSPPEDVPRDRAGRRPPGTAAALHQPGRGRRDPRDQSRARLRGELITGMQLQSQRGQDLLDHRQRRLGLSSRPAADDSVVCVPHQHTQPAPGQLGVENVQVDVGQQGRDDAYGRGSTPQALRASSRGPPSNITSTLVSTPRAHRPSKTSCFSVPPRPSWPMSRHTRPGRAAGHTAGIGLRCDRDARFETFPHCHGRSHSSGGRKAPTAPTALSHSSSSFPVPSNPRRRRWTVKTLSTGSKP
jgi:hypothetical protein